jgi:hypothetical protein
MDNDTAALQEASFALIDLRARFMRAPILQKIKLRPVIEDAVNSFAKMQLKLLEDGVIITDDDLAEIAAIKKAINKAADNQKLLQAGVRFVGFVAKFA